LEKQKEEKNSIIQKTKYTVWNENILHDYELINKINESKDKNTTQTNGYDSLYSANKKTKMPAKEKGDEYEKYIANFFREQGYYVWEHGKEKGMKDMSIDLIVKKLTLRTFQFLQLQIRNLISPNKQLHPKCKMI